MQLSSKLLDETIINTRPKIGEQTLIVMGEPTHEEKLSQTSPTNKKTK